MGIIASGLFYLFNCSILRHSPADSIVLSTHRECVYTQIAIQNFTIVIEMFITAIAHKYVFGHEAYADGSLKIIMDARAAAWKEQTDPNSYAVRETDYTRRFQQTNIT